ncbi:MAG TPA: flagellar FliJ family protein [Vicinamibacterales bacterium]
MARFRFRPQPALDLRKREEELARMAVSEAHAACEAAEASWREAQRRLDEAAARAREADAAGGDVTLAIWHRNWMRSQRREVVRCEAVAEERRVALAEAEARLVEARRRVRVLERLKERALAAYRERERQAEQRAIDELANLRFAIRQRGEHP